MARKYHKNTALKIRKVQEIAQAHYEPGNYSRSYYQVWKNYVYPVYPMCYATFLTYINTRPSQLDAIPEKRKYSEDTTRKVRLAHEMIDKHYRGSSNVRSKKAVWEKYIKDAHPDISYGSFSRYARIDPAELN